MLLRSELGPSSTPSNMGDATTDSDSRDDDLLLTQAANWHFSDQDDDTPNMKEVPTSVVDPFSLNTEDGSEE